MLSAGTYILSLPLIGIEPFPFGGFVECTYTDSKFKQYENAL